MENGCIAFSVGGGKKCNATFSIPPNNYYMLPKLTNDEQKHSAIGRDVLSVKSPLPPFGSVILHISPGGSTTMQITPLLSSVVVIPGYVWSP